ncbi:2-oxo-4-hydroxy-4-carboxy-5-ureidoimidazoline decarboxylase [Rhodococcus sp. CX]|uniref:2-oxo-4-hydroxy-4-carboxy-5-ureidoimidazoline decarboxylase n=1 Tax=Rhodococcus sp. CX TaxID=2789880 RepID=UPI0027DCF810|nr:2-oxo-4-hydroxy-4-carboxy-5-ureidoimidazoline decarboxylase [Rhodococcus sp. CX]
MDCATFDALPEADAVALLLTCCSSPAWARRVAAARPYGNRDALLRNATEQALALSDDELDDALAGHPRIGERSESAASQREQSSVATAADGVRAALAAGNRAYEEKFGHVYLVRAAGRSADELLEILNRRLGNDAATERGEVRAALADINRLRLELLIDDAVAVPGTDGGVVTQDTGDSE